MVQPQPQPQNLMNNFNKFTSNSQSINNFASTSIKVAERILNTVPTSPNDPTINNLNDLSKLKAPARFCPFKQQQTKCDPQFPYRSFDGSCNNLNNFWWGRAESPFKRFLDPDYSDQFKLNEPRASRDGSDLPNPRELACNLHSDSEEIEPVISHMFMQWGQLVNHDITSISSQPHEDDKSVCKTCTRTSKCLPIPLNTNATTCSCPNRMQSRSCIEFTRSSASFGDLSCSLGRREQLNLQTGFLDGSHIYGTDEQQAESLRDRISTSPNAKGLLRTQIVDGHHLMPAQQTDKPSDCLDFTLKTKCFHAGDDRVNQNPSLMSMHTLFVREHNRIAAKLTSLNPSWDDETVFQETRRIIIAFIQHITYNEFLPVLLGQRNMQIFSLQPQTGFNFFTMYNNTIDPRISNEYSAAAGRFGHSMVRSEYSRVNANFTTAGTQSFILRNSYFRANGLYDQCQGGLESIVRGMLKDPLMKVDRHFSNDLTQHLFEVKDKMGRPFHFDLISINIMRGRDHGIPSYTKFREFCGLQPVKTWTDLNRFIPNDAVGIMRQFYKFVEDIDLFVAGVSEFKEENSQLGPTLSCILGLQFQHLKFGDRFWYETSDFPANFTPGQLAEIRRITLSQFLCRTMIDNPQIQPRALLTRQIAENQLVNCDSLPDLNWDLWKSA